MKEGKYAFIDCGTNTFNILIVDVLEKGVFTKIIEERVTVKIGQGGIQNNTITEAAQERAIHALSYFQELCQKHEVIYTKAIATSAFRNAANGTSLAQRIEKETSISLSIIDGGQEAELIYFGVRQSYPLGSDPVLIVDIGGGSVEFIIANASDIFWKRSYEIGAQRLMDQYLIQDPIPKNEIQNLQTDLSEILSDLWAQLNHFQPKICIGSSGAFETYSHIYLSAQGKTWNESSLLSVPLANEVCLAMCQKIIASNQEVRLSILGMNPMRVDMIVVSSCLVQLILQKHPFDPIIASFYSLKEGLMFQYLYN